MRKVFFIFAAVLFFVSSTYGQTGSKLQIHFIDAGQGDAELLITPKGETVLFDNGPTQCCDMVISYLEQLGIDKIDYHVVSHYDDDHIGCAQKVFNEFPLQRTAYDRGDTPPKTTQVFQRYVKAVKDHRKTAIAGDEILLGETSNPVKIKFVAVNGNGIPTTNENDLSLVASIKYGDFDCVMGGDLSGFDENGYKDIETSVAKQVGQFEVYKVHHHCSRYSTNSAWLSVVKPKIAVISASGECGRKHNHPTGECLDRLHDAEIKTYWTEKGDGASPDPEWDKIGGNIVIEVPENAKNFTVVYDRGKSDVYSVWEAGSADSKSNPKFAWSSKAKKYYHYESCRYVNNITPANLETGSTPPKGLQLHTGCPK